MRVCSVILIVAVLLATAACLQAAPIQKVKASPNLTIDFGGGWFTPIEDGFDEYFAHGYNGRLLLNHQTRSRIQLGALYRISTREADFPIGDLDHTSHWLGLRLGYDLLPAWDMEASIGGALYAVWARLSGSRRVCIYDPNCTDYVSVSDTEGGLGWGLNFVYAYQFNERFGVGFEAEYNHSDLNYPVGPPINIDNTPLLLDYYTYDNIGGFWLTPFLRIRF